MNKETNWNKVKAIKCQFCGLIIDESYYYNYRHEMGYTAIGMPTAWYYHHIDEKHNDKYCDSLEKYSVSALEDLLEDAEKIED